MPASRTRAPAAPQSQVDTRHHATPKCPGVVTTQQACMHSIAWVGAGHSGLMAGGMGRDWLWGCMVTGTGNYCLFLCFCSLQKGAIGKSKGNEIQASPDQEIWKETLACSVTYP
jgi:hypothetical protein